MARKIALSLGLFVAFLPYLGFPEALDTVLYTIAGLIIAFLAWSGVRPSPEATIEEMEGELQKAAEEDASHTPQVSTVPPTERKNMPPEVQRPAEHASHEAGKQLDTHVPEDKLVSVSFTKHRSHNLKKRITQEEPQAPT